MPITNELFTTGTTSVYHSGDSCIFSVYYEGNRSETLILKSDLISVGFQANDVLKNLQLYIAGIPYIDLKNVKIGIKHTTKTSNPAGIFENYSTYTEVFSQSVISKTSLTIGWYTFLFNKDFIWNGNDNILVTLIRNDDVSAYQDTAMWQVRTLTSPHRYRGFAGVDLTSPMDGKTGGLKSPTYGVPSMRITVADRGGSGVPIVTALTTNRAKISDEPNVNQSVITVRFDTDVTQYVARLNGVDYATGTLVHTGGAVAANTDAQIIVDWNELTTEGSNRINVYGQNANGWTVQT